MTFTGANDADPKERTRLVFDKCKNGAGNKPFPCLCKKHLAPSIGNGQAGI